MIKLDGQSPIGISFDGLHQSILPPVICRALAVASSRSLHALQPTTHVESASCLTERVRCCCVIPATMGTTWTASAHH